MRNIVIGICAFSFFLVVMLSGYTLFGRQKRMTELEDGLNLALEQTMGNLENEALEIASNEDMIALFERLLLTQLVSAKAVEIRILDADCEKGLLSVEVVEHFKHWNGKAGTVTAQSMIIEDMVRQKVSSEKAIVTYWIEEELYRRYEVAVGESLPVPGNPDICGDSFIGWKQEMGQKALTGDELEKLIVQEDMQIYAVTE